MSKKNETKPVQVQTQQATIKSIKEYLTNSLVQLYGSEDRSDYELILLQMNQGMSMGVCAKQINYGDMAWRCMDCEKDPTCIICKDCFEKGDHTGHRVQLKRNAGGCCDCGDPEAWDEDHFCSDHKGQHDVDPKEVLEKMPGMMKNSAFQVFTQLAKELKTKCMNLQNYDEQCVSAGMSDEKYKETQVFCICHIFEFLQARVEEAPVFIHIVEQALNKVYIDPQKFVKNDEHKVCCVRAFPPNDTTEREEFEQVFQTHGEKETMCSCTPLDLCMQTNYMLDDRTRKIVYDLFFKMFQSYHFKQALTLSFSANYGKIMMKDGESEHGISSIGVQVLTSDEMSMLIFTDERLRNTVLAVFEEKLRQFRANFKDRTAFYNLFTVLHDLKYMARPESLKFCIQRTDWLERLINSCRQLYFIDCKVPRDTMIFYDQEGQLSEEPINIELYLIKVVNMYLKEVDHQDVEKNKSVLKAFFDTFAEIDKELVSKGYEAQGFAQMPVHRSFGYFLTRLLFNNMHDQGLPYKGLVEQGLAPSSRYSIQQLFRHILKDHMPGQVVGEGGSSLVGDSSEGQIDVDQILRAALRSQVKQISFVHEVTARKWIYHGEFMQYYPQIYYKLCDRLSLQDVCLVQILLSCDNIEDEDCGQTNVNEISGVYGPLIDFVIDNFGLDGHLKLLLDGLKNRTLSSADFKECKAFDAKKLQTQLLCFLKFFVQICIYEASFLKQVFNRKDEKAEAKHHIQNPNSELMKSTWAKALRKEAVHLLLLSKVNTGIQVLKGSMVEVFAKDEVYEEQLFEVSTQSRDMRNQVTFTLKDEYYPWLDPYHYILPDQQSQIHQMYQQHSLKDKFADKGVNDIVGDYLDNYEFATDLNQQLIDNVARSQLLKVVCSLLVVWLKTRKFVKDESKTDKKQQMEDAQKSLAGLFTRLKAQSDATQVGTFMNQIAVIQRAMATHAASTGTQATEVTPAFLGQSQTRSLLDLQFLSDIVDHNIGYICLKLLVMILNAHSKAMTENSKSKLCLKDRQYLVDQLQYDSSQLIAEIINFREEQAQENKKMQDLLTFILNRIYQLDNSRFSEIGVALGYVDKEDGDSVMNDESGVEVENKNQKSENKPEQNEDKKEKLKKKQAKLMAKMKSKGSKILKSNTAESTAPLDAEPAAQDEQHKCAFCQEELTRQNFVQHPFGNFVYVQKSNLLYRSLEQTVKSQRVALRNADLTNQIQIDSAMVEEEKSQPIQNEFEYPEHQQAKQAENVNQISSSSTPSYQLRPLQLVELLCDQSNFFMNKYSGSGAVFTNCKHYAHLDCLEKYHQQQETGLENQYQKQLTGLGGGEFACPICKSINNGLMPIYSLESVAQDIECLVRQTAGGKYVLDADAKRILDLYTEFISQIVITQTGFVHKGDHNEQVYKQMVQKQILLRDIKSNPLRMVAQTCGCYQHIVNLTDLKGLKDLQAHNMLEKMASTHQSTCALLRYATQGEHVVLDLIQANSQVEELINQQLEMRIDELTNETEGKSTNGRVELFAKNVVGTCIEILFYASISQKAQGVFDSQLIDYIIKQFYNILRIQFMLATLFRNNNGVLQGKVNGVMQNLSPPLIVLFEQAIRDESTSSSALAEPDSSYLQDLYTEVSLPSLRKLFAAVHILRLGACSDQDQAERQVHQARFNEVCSQTSNQQEHDLIQKYLNLTCANDMSDEDPENASSQANQVSGGSFKDLLIAKQNQEPDAMIQGARSGHFITQLLEKFGSQKFLSDNLLKFAASVAGLDGGGSLEQDVAVQMPTNLLLMTPYFEFNFAQPPTSFMKLQTEYYKRECTYCKNNVMDSVTCLLCGETICMYKINLKTQDVLQCRVGDAGQQNLNEGLICWHTRMVEGGCGLYLQTSNGRIILVQNGTVAIFDSPYRNKYGEIASEFDKSYGAFNVDEEGGGLESLRQLKARYLNHQVANSILQQRTNPDSKYKVYMKHVI